MKQIAIPKIIHHTGPDRSLWHPLWFKCYESWKTTHQDFEYRFWTDQDIDDLIQIHYPKYWDMYSNYPVHIMKIDFARFAILHHIGGIYADLDVFCYQNFYDELTQNAYIVENPLGNDPFENSLMCAASGSEFFLKCMDLSLERYEYIKQEYPCMLDDVSIISKDPELALIMRPYVVFFITGTNLLSHAYRQFGNLTATLPGIWFNNNDMSYDPSFRTKHVHTGIWGKENLQFAENLDYTSLRNIPVEHFDFYNDYSNGNYLKEKYLNIYKNDNDPLPKLGVSFGYS